jgi:inner membrane protein
MASIGHLAVGLLAGRLHGGADGPAEPRASEARASAGTLLAFAALSFLPDMDVVGVALGLPDAGACGHRGASHSFLLAALIGVGMAFFARRLGWPVVRTAVAATLAVASHGILDACGEGGRGIPLFWPLSEARFVSPWRVLPDAPRGLGMLSYPGLFNLCVEFVVFFPLTAFALWPLRPGILRRAPGGIRRVTSARAVLAVGVAVLAIGAAVGLKVQQAQDVIALTARTRADGRP